MHGARWSRQAQMMLSRGARAWVGYALLAAGLVATPASALPERLANIDKDLPSSGDTATGPGLPTAHGVIFDVETPEEGHSPWVSDGTSAGTGLLADVDPTFFFRPVELMASSGELAFFAHIDGRLPYTLWATDGTTAGTQGLAQFPDWPQEERRRFTLTAGKLFFAGRGSGGPGPWVSDGTVAGTFGLSRFAPELRGVAVDCFASSAGKAFFMARLPGDVMQLWVSDGTAGGTRELGNFPGTARSAQTFQGTFPCALSNNGRLLFRAATPATGHEVWVSDGTGAGTQLLVDYQPGPAQSFFFPIAVAGEGFLLSTFEGDTRFADGTPGVLRPLRPSTFTSPPTVIARGNERFYFLGSTPGEGRELWGSDGTDAGTQLVLDACPGACSAAYVSSVSEGSLFLEAHDNGSFLGQWVVDLSTAELREVTGDDQALCMNLRTIAPEPGGGWVATPGRMGASLRYCRVRAADATIDLVRDVLNTSNTDILPIPGFGVLLVEATAGGRPGVERLQLAALPAGASGGAVVRQSPRRDASSFPASPLAVGDEVWLTASRNGSDELWRSNGTPQGTVSVLKAGSPGETWDVDFGPILVNGALLVAFERSAPPNPSVRLFAVDPVTRTARTVTDYEETSLCEPVSTDVGLFWIEGGLTSPGTLWFTDGSTAGTGELGDLPAGAIGCNAKGGLGDRLVYLGTDATLWTSDGTPAGTRIIAQLPGSGPADGQMRRVGDQIFFLVRTDDGDQLWKTDGTEAGTMPISSHRLRGFSSPFIDPVVVGSVMFYRWHTPSAGWELWRTDGTEVGTGQVADIRPGPLSSTPFNLAAAGNRLYFAADDGLHGDELWTSDGTPEGTRLVKDIHVGPAGSYPVGARAIGERIILAASNGTQGVEMWISDGTESGTRLVTDLRPGPYSSHPYGFTPVGDHLFFAATDGVSGWEPWALPLPELADTCEPAEQELCLLGERIQVAVRFLDPRDGVVKQAHPVPFSDLSGFFWFFSDTNIELVVKMLDGRGINGAFWTFYGALSDVEYWVEVADTVSGVSKTYYNPPKEICGVGDVESLPVGTDPLVTGDPLTTGDPLAASEVMQLTERTFDWEATQTVAKGASACNADAETLCLLSGRFAVEVDWRNQRTGETGTGSTVAGTDRSGYFTFFNPSNVELVVKMLDGRAENGHFWLFYGALSDVEYTIHVTDTETGAQQTYVNPPGNICGQADVRAF